MVVKFYHYPHLLVGTSSLSATTSQRIRNKLSQGQQQQAKAARIL